MDATVRRLTDADLAAVEALLTPTEDRSAFLLGNARAHGIDDRGARLNGPWFGAFEGGRLEGVVAAMRMGSVLPACGPHARPLVTALSKGLAAAGASPAQVVGTRERVADVLAAAPPSWRVSAVRSETLLVLRWPEWKPPARRVATVVAGPEHADDVGRLLDVLSAEGGLPMTPESNRARGERAIAEGRVRVALFGGRAVAVSMEAAATGKYVHVGATATDPAHRRQGLAGACVADVAEAARAAGRASEGAVIFTGHDNGPALSLYRSMGFGGDVPWSIALLDPPGAP